MSTGHLGRVSSESKLVIAVVSGSEFINHTYLVLLPPILGLLAGDFGVSLALLGVAIGARGAATAAFQLPFGYVSDRYDRTIGLGLSLGLGGLGALLTAIAPTFGVLVVAQILLGIGVAGHHPSHFPLLSEAVEPEFRGRVFSIRAFAGALGFATPPIVVTAVLALPGTSWRHAVGLMGLAGLAYGLLAIGLFRRYVGRSVTRPDPAEIPERGAGATVADRILTELRGIASMRAVLALGFLTLVSATAVNGFRTYIVVHLTDGYGLALASANLTLTALFVASAILILVGGSLADRLPAGRVLVAVYAGAGLLTALVASLVIPAALAALVVVAVGGVHGIAGPARSKLVDRFAPTGAVGQSFAVMTVGMMLGGTVAPPVFGYLIDTVGLRGAFLTLAGVTFVALVTAYAVTRVYD